MATAAEMKARLAKYAKAIPGGAAPSITDDSARNTTLEKAVVPEPLQPVVAAENRSLAVQTDVQPTDVVVLERPREQAFTGEEEKPATNLDVTNPVHQDFLQRLADLEAALLLRDPLMKTHLGAIHKMMIGYEEIANLLTVEEISKIMEAQQQHTGIVLRAETVGKSKAAATKKANQLSINDV